MALSEAKLMEVEQALKENPDFMTQDDHIEEHVKGDYWNGLFNSTQTRGNFYFTKEKMIFVSGWGLNSFAIKYSDIREVRKCMISLFIPTGILVTAVDENGKEKKYKCSVLKRAQWLEFLSRKTGIALA